MTRSALPRLHPLRLLHTLIGQRDDGSFVNEPLYALALLFVALTTALAAVGIFAQREAGRFQLQAQLAYRQAALTQSIAKSVMQLELSSSPLARNAVQQELASNLSLFASTITAFRTGSTITGLDGQPLAVRPLDDAEATDIIQGAMHVWEPFAQAAGRSATEANLDPRVLAINSEMAAQVNLSVMDSMNTLAHYLETRPDAQLKRLRHAGIALAALDALILLLLLLALRQRTRTK